jgi:hypothetical protein
MATRRTSKKTEPTDVPVVTQVVEEVTDEKPEEVIAEIKEEAQKIEEAAGKLEEIVPEEAPPPERAVVSELYKEKSPLITPEYVVESGSSMKPLLIWSLVVIGIALLSGGILLVAVKSFQGLRFTAKPTPTPTSVPTPTPAPAANRADIKVQVLNGGGVAGSGSKMKAFLEEKGYTVSDVKNADEFTFEETEVHVKSGNDAYADLLKKDLGEKYTIGTAAATLAADSTFDAQVIVGKK